MEYGNQKQYSALSEQGGNLQPPPQRRNLPPARFKDHRSRRGSCCGCLCWCCCFLLLFLIILGAIACYFIFVYKPQVPSYSVDKLAISTFEFSASDLTLSVKLVATVTADNPNTMIGITYGSGSRVVVMYQNTPLCSGKLPSFYQGHQNKTVMQITMEGRHGYDSRLQQALQENQQSGSVPTDIYVSVPVSLKLGGIDLKQVTVNILCSLVVDSLQPNKQASIRSTKYKVNVEF
ncbi:protein YLS9 [Canna indica]|uniref:Protein YLS9 n=1 Tax=Canna indica TaxID=4628 RepID=A0AAQ3Q6T6_9LILI|nr:protein YLS9 [Canna indica]